MDSKPKNIEFENCKQIIKRFLNPEKINYPREIKLSKQLLKKYPFGFFNFLKPPFYPVSIPSLAWFLTEDGKKYLTLHYFEYIKDNTNLTLKAQEVKLEKEKVGKDIRIENNKPKSLQDFLGMFKNDK